MSIEWDIDLSGLDEMTDRMEAAMPAAIVKALEHVRTVATPLTPIQSGDLRGGYSVTAKGMRGEIANYSVYARYQHYGLDFQHPVGQALFLEQPMVTETGAVGRIIGEALRTVM